MISISLPMPELRHTPEAVPFRSPGERSLFSKNGRFWPLFRGDFLAEKARFSPRKAKPGKTGRFYKIPPGSVSRGEFFQPSHVAGRRGFISTPAAPRTKTRPFPCAQTAACPEKASVPRRRSGGGGTQLGGDEMTRLPAKG